MRNDWRVRAVVLLGSVLAAAGCTTTQPDSLGTRTASLRIVTTATVEIFNCYELWTDDSDGIPQFTGAIECYLAPPPDVPTRRSVPWHYSATVSIIHKGSTQEEIVTSLSGAVGSSVEPGDGIDNFISLSEYDPTDQPASVIKNPEVRAGVLTSFLNGKKVSRGSRFWLSSEGYEFGESNVLSASPTFDFEVDSGDTVVVRARKQLEAETPQFIQDLPVPEITLSGTLSVGGALISPTGATKSTAADGAGISFSFTVQ